MSSMDSQVWGIGWMWMLENSARQVATATWTTPQATHGENDDAREIRADGTYYAISINYYDSSIGGRQ